MTEDEVKTKWCCASWRGDTQGHCIGSICMAWRWHKPPYANEPKGGDGYCGLAGKP